MKRSTIIIPSLNPDKKLLDYVDSLIQEGFSEFIIIDDGSKVEIQDIFDLLEDREECVVLHHIVNMGKGRALKDAFNYYLAQKKVNDCGDFTKGGVITVDSDGQHKVEDVLKLDNILQENSDALILGARNFFQENVPVKSKFGNQLTRKVMKFLYGGNITDTQTGLRGILCWPHVRRKFIESIPRSSRSLEYSVDFFVEKRKPDRLQMPAFLLS